ncbi:MAG: DJ-1/PfpI family protein [Opitutaceae bacterium]|nr:DJ-1/PfpI family protein [Cytophagales bacterium]
MKKTKKVLAILSEFGYWGVELVGPLKKLEAAGYKLDFMTTYGKKAEALPPSYDTTYIDPPLGVCVTTESDANMVKEFESQKRLETPMNMSEYIPERPYGSAKNFLRELEGYNNKVKQSVTKLVSGYDSILLVGGSGPIVDMVNNQRLHELVLGFYRSDKPVAAICYGVPVLAFARDFNERKSIIRGKHVTGHCIEYDYHDGTGFLHTDFNIGAPPYVLEYVMSDAVGTDGQYHGNFGKETSVIVDYPFITARSLQCSHEFGDQLVNVLDNDLKRYGW